MKSILFHYHGDLHFHFLTDRQTEPIIAAFMQSWLIPGCLFDSQLG